MRLWRGGAVALWLTLAATSHAWAWGDAGHRILCEIAWQEFAPETRTAVLAILARDEPRYRRFFDSCVWGHREGTEGPFENRRHEHYLDVPRHAERISLEEHCPRGCVVSAIVRYTNQLMRPDTDAETRLAALKFLDHLVGDVHQPLHVGFIEDRGGNETYVRLSAYATIAGDEPIALHDLWDTWLLEIGGMGRGRWRRAAAQLHQAITSDERAAWSVLDPLLWAEESHELVRREVYGGADEAYVDRSLAIVRRRLQQGGVRLARLLDAIVRGEAPFFVEDRRTGLVHHPACPDVGRVPPGRLRILTEPPLPARRHDGCPWSGTSLSGPEAAPQPAPSNRR